MTSQPVRPTIGQPAPALDLVDVHGTPWHGDDHRGKYLLLIFHRHIHWVPCATHAIAVRDRLDEFGHDVAVVLVTFTQPAAAAEYVETKHVPFPILIDADRASYWSYGLGRGSVARVWGWRATRRYFEIWRQVGLPGWKRPTEDTLQLGGDFVIDPDGTLTFGYWSDGPDDRPSVDELIAAIETDRAHR